MPKIVLADEGTGAISLDGEWRFKTDADGTGMDKKWFEPGYDDQQWSTITVPSFWEKSVAKDFDGTAWYRKKFSAAGLTGKSFALSFRGVDDECEVWLNGEKIGAHTGWNQPFYFDVTRKVRTVSDNYVAVRVKDWGWDGGMWKSVSLRSYVSEDDLLKGDLFDKSALSSADWVKEAVIYEIYLRSFSEDSKITTLESRLPELKALGVTCLWLMPINPVGAENRKGSLGSPYAVKDYLGVNLEFGTKDTFKKFVQEAHLQGFKVIIDWVANHTAWDNALVKAHPEWFMKDKDGKIVPPNEHWTDVAGLNYKSDELREYMKDALVHWVKEYDIDGFRCDVADMLPVDFWEYARKELDKTKRGLLMLAEGDRPENHLASFDLTYAWNVNDALVEIAEGKADVTRLREKLKNEYFTYPRGSLRLRFSENHDKPRAAQILGPGHLAAAALIFTLEGVPLLYNGQEIGEVHQPSLFEKETIGWGKNRKEQSNMRKFYSKLVTLRRKNAALMHGQRFPVNSSDDKRMFAFARSYRGDAALVAINLSPKEFKGTLEIPEVFVNDKGKLNTKPAFPGHDLQLSDGLSAKLTLPAWGYQIWTLK